MFPRGVRRGFESRDIMCPSILSILQSRGGGCTIAFFHRDETPEAAETGLGEFGLGGLVGVFGGECGERGMELERSLRLRGG